MDVRAEFAVDAVGFYGESLVGSVGGDAKVAKVALFEFCGQQGFDGVKVGGDFVG